MCIPPTISSRDLPWPSATPTVRLRLRGLAQVATRSPTPAKPPNVSICPPRATPRRPSSASPRVISTAGVLSPRPSPSEIPAAMASTFLVAPATSQPTTSVPDVDAEGATCGRGPGLGGPGTRRAAPPRRRPDVPDATSRARLGPVSTPAGTPGTSSATTCDIRRFVPSSIPLARLTIASTCRAGGGQRREDGAKAVGRHGHEDDAGSLEGVAQRRRHHHLLGELHTGQVSLVLPGGFHGGGQLRGTHPQESRGRYPRSSPWPSPRTQPRSLRPGRSCHKRLRRPREALCAGPYTVPVSRATGPAAWDAHAAADARSGPEVVLIPVKAFHQAKRRLGATMADPQRERLVRTMASHVLSACAPLPVAVVCDDEDVARWATDLGAGMWWEPGQGLNGAVRAGVDRLAGAGARWVTVAHGDLPRARGLGTLPTFDGVTLRRKFRSTAR